jgi:hypothetical protein
MSSGLNIDFVRDTYQRMSDKDLIRTLTQDAAGLTLEAQEVVKEEIKRRKLGPDIERGIAAQQKTYTIAEIDAYCDIIQHLPCPVTGSTAKKLNATRIAEVMSFIVFTNYDEKTIIGSPEVLDKANERALTKTLLLGWWGFPHGLIKTPQAIAINRESKKTNHFDTPNNHLRRFVLSKIGEIETYKNNREKLMELIKEG